MTNQKLIADFIEYLVSKNKSQSTVIAYSKDLSQLAETVDKPLTAVTGDEIKKFISKLGLTPKTVSRKLNSFRTFYKYLEQKKLISANPAMSVAHPKFQPTKPRVLSSLEYLALRQISNENTRLYTMIELMLQTGIRIGELSRLNISDIEIKKTKTYINIQGFSTSPGRIIELNVTASRLIRSYLKAERSNAKPNEALFATRDGKHIIIRNIRSSIDRAINKAGIKSACVNDLRNTFIVHQLANGLPLERLTEVVGHKSKATTSRYVDLLSEPYREKSGSKIAEL